jgi:hypothetical protein
MMGSGFCDQQVGNRCPVPHSVVDSEVALEHKSSLQQVRRRGDDIKAGVQLGADGRIGAARRCALVEEPACYRHICSEAIRSTSTYCESRFR